MRILVVTDPPCGFAATRAHPAIEPCRHVPPPLPPLGRTSPWQICLQPYGASLDLLMSRKYGGLRPPPSSAPLQPARVFTSSRPPAPEWAVIACQITSRPSISHAASTPSGADYPGRHTRLCSRGPRPVFYPIQPRIPGRRLRSALLFICWTPPNPTIFLSRPLPPPSLSLRRRLGAGRWGFRTAVDSPAQARHLLPWRGHALAHNRRLGRGSCAPSGLRGERDTPPNRPIDIAAEPAPAPCPCIQYTVHGMCSPPPEPAVELSRCGGVSSVKGGRQRVGRAMSHVAHRTLSCRMVYMP